MMEAATSSRRHLPIRIPLVARSIILVFLYLGVMAIVALSDWRIVFEPPLLLPVMNTLFAAVIPFIVAFIAARSYLASGIPGLLHMGCGMLAFGSGALVAGWLISVPDGQNVNVTIYNSCALLGALMNAGSAVMSLRKMRRGTEPGRRVGWLVLTYSATSLLLLLITMTTLRGWAPRFFVQGTGPTLIRQSVLGAAVGLYLLSAFLYLKLWRMGKKSFHHYYALAMALIGLGLFAFFIQKSVGSPIGWVGRSGQYIGGLCALSAILAMFREARRENRSMQAAMADIFRAEALSYRALVETITDPIVTFREDGTIIQWTKAAARVFGHDESEALGASLFGLVVDGLSRAAFRAGIGALEPVSETMKTGKPLEIGGRTKDGSIIPIEASVSATKTGDHWSYICVFRDISERKKAESEIMKLNEDLERRVAERTEELRNSEESFRSFFENATIGIFQSSPEGRFLRVNPALARMLGYGSPEELITTMTDIGTQACVDRERRPAIVAALDGKGWVRSENQYRRKDGSILAANLALRKVLNPDGSTAYLEGLVEDITERKRTEMEIQRLASELERRVAERTAQLERANREMEAFAYSVSHDLRAPLRAIDGFSRFLMEDYAEKLDTEGNRLLGVIRKNTQRMDQLIIELLDLSRVSREELRSSLVDMSSLVATVLAEAAPPDTLATFEVDLRTLSEARGDHSLLRQVWSNLVSNALKYSMRAPRRRIEIGSYPEAGGLVYYIRDEGAGFDPEYADKLFGVFQRLHRIEEFEGNGVGLAIVQRIVLRHGGRVWAEGMPGHGATFFFSLPNGG